eukprot:4631612-Pleurochrysis_carterae.AAC.2
MLLQSQFCLCIGLPKIITAPLRSQAEVTTWFLFVAVGSKDEYQLASCIMLLMAHGTSILSDTMQYRWRISSRANIACFACELVGRYTKVYKLSDADGMNHYGLWSTQRHLDSSKTKP